MILSFVSITLSHVTPVPKEFVKTSTKYIQAGQIDVSCISGREDCMKNLQIMLNEYLQVIFPKGLPDVTVVKTKVQIEVISLKVPLNPLVANESYELIANESGFFIKAQQTIGVARALATLAQLIEELPGQEYVPGVYGFQPCKIADAPVFPYRQLMVDASRHFLPLSALQRQVRAISMAKMNVLHIHVIDSQSNAYAPKTKPADEFEKAGYYNGRRYLIYANQLAELAEMALGMGVFLKIEMDMPGHATSWRNVKEGLIANCPGQGYSSINPLNEEVYTYIESYLSDFYFTIFNRTGQPPIIHLGGDEVDHNCWNSDASIKKYMNDNKITTAFLWQQFHQRIQEIIKKISNEVLIVYWQESYENGNKFLENSIVHVWYDWGALKKATDQGYMVLRSEGFYLDVTYWWQSTYLFQDTWQFMYKVDVAEGVNEDKKKLVIGGGPCMWCEKCNEGNIDEQMWPRAAAVGEVLWSNPVSREITDELKDRMASFACKLLQFGVRTGPIQAQQPCPGIEIPHLD